MQVATYKKSNFQSKNTSFKGLTGVFKKRIFSYEKTYLDLANLKTQPYVGSLPPEIIKDVKKIAHNSVEKNEIIKNLYEGFSKAAEIIRQKQDTFSYMPLYRNSRHEKAYVNDFIKEACKHAGEELTNAFKNAGLLKKTILDNKIKLEYLGHGAYGDGLAIKFPSKMKYSTKVLKVFYPQKYNLRKAHHGFLPEANAASYVSNISGQKVSKRPFVDFYFGSMKDNFMVLEHAKNYKNLPKINYVLSSLINCQDTHINNMINGRLIDYGSVKSIAGKTSRKAIKTYKKLAKVYVDSKLSNNNKVFEQELEKLSKMASKGKNSDSKDIQSGIMLFNRSRVIIDRLVNTQLYYC